MRCYIYSKQDHSAAAIRTMYRAAWCMRGGLGGRICHASGHESDLASATEALYLL
jgi:hypothetical protein